MSRSSGSTMTMASYPGCAPRLSSTRARTQAQHPARLREPAPRRHGRRADQPVDRVVRSHFLPERRVSDTFVNVVLAEIALPLLRVKAKRSYSGAELRELCAAPASRPASTPRCIVVRLFILVRLDVDAIAVFAPDEGAALMRSVVHGFGWGIGHEITTAFSATDARASPGG